MYTTNSSRTTDERVALMEEQVYGGAAERDGGLFGLSQRRWLYVILILSVLVRVAVALYLGNLVDAPPLLTDQRSYHALGERLLNGHGYSFDRAWYPFTLPDTPTAHWSFLYSLFVAVVYGVLGPNPLAVRLVQAVIGGVLLPWMVFRLSRRLWPNRAAVALISAALAGAYGYFVLHAATLMTETFFIILLLWSLEIGLRLGEQLRESGSASVRDLLFLGLSLGLAALVRQSILPWVPVMLAWLMWQSLGRTGFLDAIARLVVPLLVLGALILPWTVRNYWVYGEFLLLNSNTGYAMYSAQHPMHGTRFSEFAAAPLPTDLSWGNEALMDRELLQRGLAFIRDEPIRYVRLCIDRVRAYFEFWPSAGTSLLHNLARVGSYGFLLPCIVWGLVRGSREHVYDVSAWLLLGFVIVYTMIHVATWAMVRYRLPIDAVLLPWAGLGVEDLVRRVRAVFAARRLPVPR